MALVTPGVFSGGFQRGAGAATSGIALQEQLKQQMRDNVAKTAEGLAQAYDTLLVRREKNKDDPDQMNYYNEEIKKLDRGLNGLIEASSFHAQKAGIDPMEFIGLLERSRLGTGALEKSALKQDEKSGRGGYVTLQEVADEKDNVFLVPFDHRTGRYRWNEKQPLNERGLPISPKDPSVQGAVAGAKKGAGVEAEARTTAQIDLPKLKSDAEYLKGIVQGAVEHPGFEGAVGAPGWGKAMKYVSGTKESDFMGYHKQITGKTFMQAYQTLKGGGQITEIEGQKATEAMQRIDTARSEKEYKKAADDFISEIDRLTWIAEQRATGKVVVSTQEEYDALPPGTEYYDSEDQKRYRKP